MLGGILLVFPGFITDVLGALLLSRRSGASCARLIGRARETRRRQRDPSVIDLTPKEWHQVSEKPIKDGRPRKRVHDRRHPCRARAAVLATPPMM